MSKPDLWTRLREARILQVLVVYLGASWGGILQVVDVLQGGLALSGPHDLHGPFGGWR